ncbi:MAG TPA: hypothetical protein VFZ63_19505 [Jiangellaceae bacterium]
MMLPTPARDPGTKRNGCDDQTDAEARHGRVITDEMTLPLPVTVASPFARDTL